MHRLRARAITLALSAILSACGHHAPAAFSSSGGHGPVPSDAPSLDASRTLEDAALDAPTDTAVSQRIEPPDASPSTTPPQEKFRGRELDALLVSLRTLPVRRLLQRYRSTNVTFRMELRDGTQIAFKPDRRGQMHWWKHDVIAHALGRMLGLADRIPPVAGRRVPMFWFRRYADPDGIAHMRRDRNAVMGAAIVWMPVLNMTDLHTEHGKRRWARWLRVDDTTAPVLPTASDISSLIVFDYLQANEDRWNGANIRADESGRIVFRDNNNGWFPFALRNLRYGLFRLRSVQRFSRAFIDALSHADGASLARAVAAQQPSRKPLMSRDMIASYERRRQLVLSHVRALVARYGEARVLCWP